MAGTKTGKGLQMQLATPEELRSWAETIRQWAKKVEDIWTVDLANSLAIEMERIARREEALEREAA
jgi:hypothetical protein